MRAERLAGRAIDIWTALTLKEDILEAYREKKPDAVSEYTIDEHQHLAKGYTRELFDAFRKEVLALDECVREEYWKLYVAFKAETNFVDVVPQAKRLRLSLNMEFHEIYDPRGKCKDVTNIGRWGNGNVEVGFEHNDDLPYVIGLVRQALELQMDEGASDV